MHEFGSTPPIPPLRAALRCRCPRCGEGPVFDGLLAVAPRCAVCGLDLSAQDAGDGPAVFVILLLGAVVVGLAATLELVFAPPIWVHIVLWLPATLGGAIALLRPLKAGMIAMQYRHLALGGGPEGGRPAS
ncbi:MAG TPA: DUF983 domain-containing protein [Stellaceae bacterium]|nr:DUF983 domain-containing protein [Stellaceae bacterium]